MAEETLNVSPEPEGLQPSPEEEPIPLGVADELSQEPTEAPTPAEPIAPYPDLPDAGKFLFEDFFPPLDLDEGQEEALASWFDKDLKKCVREVNQHMDSWAMYRAVYMLEYVEKFYPGNEWSADFPSGLLLEKVIEGMDRVKKAVFGAYPYFAVDDQTSNVASIEFIHRAQWFMHTLMTRDLKIRDVLFPDSVFDFLLDGSAIVEADQMYEKVPQRALRTYFDEESLMADGSKLVDETELERALLEIDTEGKTRVLVEQELLTKDGLQFFTVDKSDHLIPPGVYRDEDVRFRARRMYLTKSDLRLLADAGWYDKEKVDEVISYREDMRYAFRGRTGNESLMEADRLAREASGELCFDWRSQEDLSGQEQPYEDTWATYRILAKYAYRTKQDSKGMIPKFCLFDYEPETKKILRARTYPHFHEIPPYFHFKLGHAPKSYYGLGYGARLVKDDFLEANAVDLYMDASAIATFRPYVTLHPEQGGGGVPFLNGLHPQAVGFVQNLGEFQPFETGAPPTALIQHILPIIKTRAENKTSVTSLVQGRTESSDPRSPAQKTELLLGEALVGLEAQIEDWNRTWERIPEFVWKAEYERMVYQGQEQFKDHIRFPGLAPDLEQNNKITMEELRRDIAWTSQASASNTNDQVRQAQFLQQFQFFSPLVQALAQIDPALYMKYFFRWMRWAAYEMRIRGRAYLVPSAEELKDISVEQAVGISRAVREQLASTMTGPMHNQPVDQGLPGDEQ